MGERALSVLPPIAVLKLLLPNEHHFAVDLAGSGKKICNEVFLAAGRPYGLIEAIMQRDNAPPVTEICPLW